MTRRSASKSLLVIVNKMPVGSVNVNCHPSAKGPSSSTQSKDERLSSCVCPGVVGFVTPDRHGPSSTVIVSWPETPPLVALSVAGPGPTAVTSPPAVTETTSVSELDQVTERPCRTTPLVSRTVAMTCTTSPIPSSVLDASSTTAPTGGGEGSGEVPSEQAKSGHKESTAAIVRSHRAPGRFCSGKAEDGRLVGAAPAPTVTGSHE